MSFPRGEAAQVAWTILEWALESSEARRVAPHMVAHLRRDLEKLPFTNDEIRWVKRYRLALRIWQRGYDAHLERQRKLQASGVEGLF